MKTRIFIILILFGFLAISNTGYGCNVAPVADLDAEPNVLIYQSVVLDGSDSYDSDGSIIEYQWDFKRLPDTKNSGSTIAQLVYCM